MLMCVQARCAGGVGIFVQVTEPEWLCVYDLLYSMHKVFTKIYMLTRLH